MTWMVSLQPVPFVEFIDAPLQRRAKAEIIQDGGPQIQGNAPDIFEGVCGQFTQFLHSLLCISRDCVHAPAKRRRTRSEVSDCAASSCSSRASR